MAEAAVIFDVDGVLLQLTTDEEEIFFTALSRFVPTQNLSRDWNSYEVRNDENIIAEILRRNQLPATLIDAVKSHYLSLLQSSAIRAVAISGAAAVLHALQSKAHLGIATANFLVAAQHRLQQVGLWQCVSAHAQGADGGGAKTEILGRALSKLNLQHDRVVYIGDNLNDVAAGLDHGVHFIGFSDNSVRQEELRQAGAKHISANHIETSAMIDRLLA